MHALHECIPPRSDFSIRDAQRRLKIIAKCGLDVTPQRNKADDENAGTECEKNDRD
jgi:hypothetical protein